MYAWRPLCVLQRAVTGTIILRLLDVYSVSVSVSKYFELLRFRVNTNEPKAVQNGTSQTRANAV